MKSQDVFSPNCQIETFVLYNCSRKAPDIQGFFPCCEQHFYCVAINIPFSAVSPIQYTEGSHRAVEITLGGLFAARKTERRFSLWYSKSHRSSGQKSTPLCTRLAVIAIRATVCCWMTLKCSAEPKCRDVARIAVFAAEAEPFWLGNKIYPQWARMRFSVSVSRFFYALRGASHGITSRDFVCHKSPITAEIG